MTGRSSLEYDARKRAYDGDVQGQSSFRDVPQAVLRRRLRLILEERPQISLADLVDALRHDLEMPEADGRHPPLRIVASPWPSTGGSKHLSGTG